jgi:hypothetical protein
MRLGYGILEWHEPCGPVVDAELIGFRDPLRVVEAEERER